MPSPGRLARALTGGSSNSHREQRENGGSPGLVLRKSVGHTGETDVAVCVDSSGRDAPALLLCVGHERLL